MSVVAISDQLLNMCCLLATSSNSQVTQSTISDILSILEVQDETKIPLMFQKKYQLAKAICSIKQQDFKCEKLILLDQITLSGYFKEYEAYIQGLATRELDEEQVQKAVEVIGQRKEYLSVFKNAPEVEEFLTKLKTQEFNSVEKTIDAWKELITDIHANIVRQQRVNNLQNISELDLADDDYEPILHQIHLSYSGVNSISTGYPDLDKYMNGGFAPARLYIFGATSGGGKSVLLINLIKNAVETNIPRDDEIATFVYVTLENLIDETLMRLYCSLTRQTTDFVISHYETEKAKIPQVIKEWLAKHRCKIKFIYRRPSVTSMTDIVSYCDVVKSSDTQISIKGVFIDYLDLMKAAGQQFDVYRLEMGQIAIDMKIGAVILRCPVVSVTQLNRCLDLKSRINIKGRGDIEIKDVKLGDEIETESGFHKVDCVFPISKQKCWKIKTKSGKEIICGFTHTHSTPDGEKSIASGLSINDKLYTMDSKDSEVKICN